MNPHAKAPKEGYTPAFLNCGGCGQPPLAIKYRGRWWRTHWVHHSYFPNADPAVVAFARSLGFLPFGLYRFQQYLARSGRTFKSLPLIEKPPRRNDAA